MNGAEGNLYPKGVKSDDAQANEAALAELARSRGQTKGEMLAAAWSDHAAAMAEARASGVIGPEGESREEFYARKGAPVPVYPRAGVPSLAVARKALYAPAAAVKVAPVKRPRPAAPRVGDQLAAQLAAARARITDLERENGELREAIAQHFRRRLEVVA